MIVLFLSKLFFISIYQVHFQNKIDLFFWICCHLTETVRVKRSANCMSNSQTENIFPVGSTIMHLIIKWCIFHDSIFRLKLCLISQTDAGASSWPAGVHDPRPRLDGCTGLFHGGTDHLHPGVCHLRLHQQQEEGQSVHATHPDRLCGHTRHYVCSM